MNQFRHCKAILALGASSALLRSAGIDGRGAKDPGLLMMDAGSKNAAQAFIAAVAKDRFRERETDPPMV
jgi:catalase